MRAIVISLHKEWWQRMKAGEKLLEIRKTRQRGNGPYTVLVYVTGGVGMHLGLQVMSGFCLRLR